MVQRERTTYGPTPDRAPGTRTRMSTTGANLERGVTLDRPQSDAEYVNTLTVCTHADTLTLGRCPHGTLVRKYCDEWRCRFEHGVNIIRPQSPNRCLRLAG